MKRYEEMSIKNLKIKSKNIRMIADASWAISAFGPWFSPPELKPYMSIGLLAYFGLTMYRNLAIDGSINKNKEYLEFQKIYSEVLDNMVNLSKSLDNKTAMEHYALYRGLLEYRMLSCSQSDNIYHDSYYEPFIAPEFTLNGHGVCRHQAAMGCDFYSKLGIENQFEVCHLSTDTSVLPDFDAVSYSMEKLILDAKNDGREEYVALFNEFLEEINDIKENIKKGASNKKKNSNNHAIIKVNDNDRTYFLDTAQKTFYTGSDNPTVFHDHLGKIIDIGVDTKDKKRYAKLSPVITTHSVPTSENLLSEYRKSIFKFGDNLDMIIQFRKENKDRLERAEEIYIKSLKK